MATINEDILRRNFGFNDINVINNILRDPAQVARYEREYQGIINPQPATTAPTPQPDLSGILREGSNAAIETLRSGVSGLNSTYDDLIASIRGDKAGEIEQSNILSSRELGQRGISTNSTFAGEYQQSRRLPIERSAQGAEAAVGVSRNTAQQNIDSAIAGIQSATSLNEVNTILEQYRQAEQTRQFNENLAFQRYQSEIQQSQFNQELNQPQTSIQTVGGRVLLIDSQTGATIADLGSSSSGSGGGGLTTAQKQQLANDVMNKASGGATLSDLQRDYGSKIGVDTVVQLYAASTKYGPVQESYAQEILGIRPSSTTSNTWHTSN